MQAYPTYSTFAFGIARDIGTTKMYIPLDNAIKARLRITSQAEIESLAAKWLDYYKKALKDIEAGKSIHLIFNPGQKYLFPTSQGSKMLPILEASPESIAEKLIAKITDDPESSLDSATLINPSQEPYAGEAVLSAKVMSKTSSETHFPRIWDAHYSGSRLEQVLTGVICTCDAYNYVSMKPTRQRRPAESQRPQSQLFCEHAYALVLFAAENKGKSKIQNYYSVKPRGKDTDFFIPFNPGRFIRDSEHAGPDEEKDMLFFECLLEHFFNDSPWYAVSQQLALHPECFHPIVTQWFDENKCSYEAIPATIHPETGAIPSQLIKKIESALKKNKWARDGFVYENFGTGAQAVCPNFRRDNEELRIYTNGGPPVLIHRTQNNHPVDLTQFQNSGIHPIGYAFSKDWHGNGLVWPDSRSMRKTPIEVFIPITKMHPQISQDYQELISRFHPAGIEGFRKLMKEFKKTDTYRSTLG